MEVELLKEQMVVCCAVCSAVVREVIVDQGLCINSRSCKTKVECHTLCDCCEVGNVVSLKSCIILCSSSLNLTLYTSVDIGWCLCCKVVVENLHITVEVCGTLEEECNLCSVLHGDTLARCSNCCTFVGNNVHTSSKVNRSHCTGKLRCTVSFVCNIACTDACSRLQHKCEVELVSAFSLVLTYDCLVGSRSEILANLFCTVCILKLNACDTLLDVEVAYIVGYTLVNGIIIVSDEQ